MKKTLTIIAICFFLLGGAVVVDGSREDFRRDLDRLEETLSTIMASLGVTKDSAQEGEEITGIPSGFSFNQNLSRGSKRQDVKYLQIILNSDLATRVSQTGPGSPGNETDFFGPATESAVKKFQNKYSSEVLTPHNLSSPTGFVGPSTRAKLNSILAQGIGEDSDIVKAIREIQEALEKLAKRVDDLEKDDIEKELFGTIECFKVASDTITLAYEVENAANATIFKGGAGIENIGSGERSGTYDVTRLSPNTNYTFYLRNGPVSTAEKLDKVVCRTDKTAEQKNFDFYYIFGFHRYSHEVDTRTDKYSYTSCSLTYGPEGLYPIGHEDYSDEFEFVFTDKEKSQIYDSIEQNKLIELEKTEFVDYCLPEGVCVSVDPPSIKELGIIIDGKVVKKIKSETYLPGGDEYERYMNVIRLVDDIISEKLEQMGKEPSYCSGFFPHLQKEEAEVYPEL